LWRAILVYVGGQRHIADDAVAEAFARAIANGVAIRQPKSWLYKTAFRLAAAELRSQRNQGQEEEAPIVDDHEVLEVLDALRQLPPGQRAAIFLRYQLDMSPQEVAEVMGTNQGAVRVSLHRGRRRLKKLLTDEESGT